MRLIDADALMDDINELKKSPWYNNAFRIDFLSDINGSRVVRSEAIDIVQRLCIDDAPTIDAVEVVRCRECKYFVDEGFYCGQNILPMFDHFYCYYGERKTESQTERPCDNCQEFDCYGCEHRQTERSE